jgi:hypothetical protein
MEELRVVLVMSVALVGVPVVSLEGASLEDVSLEYVSTADVVVFVKGHGGEAARVRGRRMPVSIDVCVRRIVLVGFALGERVGCIDVSD